MTDKKPLILKPGDTIAIVSPSWGGPGIFPLVYENGLKALKEWGLVIREYPTARAENTFLVKNPRARAKDINDAFAAPEVKAIFASIGGDDSVRILPFLDKKVISENPKILMGYSDTTTLLTFCNQLGMVTFHGPSIMAGFSQLENLPKAFHQHIRDMLFSWSFTYQYKPYGLYCDGYPDWMHKENIGKTNGLKQDAGWNFIQGSGIAEGILFGGCIEVLQFMNGTDFWPHKDFWNGRILFLETSEDKPSVKNVKWMLRNYGMQGIFDKISALLFGRPRDYSTEEKNALDKMIIEVVKGEFGNHKLMIVTNMDFGHTDPQFILPLGIKAKVDCSRKTFELTEPALKE
jgi:muramoyltetrapeptide carboxypeptidase LdcA involved in peptidoglycan recycling